MRPLTPEEAELWARVAATIRPISREPVKFSPGRGRAPPNTVEGARFSVASTLAPLCQSSGLPPPRAGEESRQRRLPAATLDSRWDRRLRSGAVEPDRVLDLHGRNLDQAWRAIDDALERAIAAGERVILLITGHARPGDPPIARGRIRSAVFDWLASSPHGRQIAAVRPAHRRHGGAGSLYIILRRSRP